MATVRRGRLPQAEVAARRAAVLRAARDEICEHGYDQTTMLAIARRSGASKETLYAWFGSKQDLAAEIVQQEADATAAVLDKALTTGPDDPRSTLRSFAVALLDLLCSPWSVAINRGAMSAAELGEVVLAGGRHSVGPRVERLLESLRDQRVLDVDSSAEAFTELYGLIVRDAQIRVLLGEPIPTRPARRRQAERGVEAFWRLHARQGRATRPGWFTRARG